MATTQPKTGVTGRNVPKAPTAGPAQSKATLSTTGTPASTVSNITGQTELSSKATKAGEGTDVTEKSATSTDASGFDDDNTRRKMHLAHLWDQVNHCGAYQGFVMTMTVLPNFLCGFILLVNVFVLGTPHHRCYMSGCDDNQYANVTALSLSWKDNTSMSTRDNNTYFCHRYEVTDGCSADFNKSKVVSCDHGMVYDYSSMAPSAVNEWGLVCKDEVKAQISKAVFMSGMLFSSIICGSLADKFGRISTYWWAPALLIVCGIMSAHTDGILTYTLTSFFMSFCAYGMVISDFTIGVEVVPKDWRVRAGQAYPVTFALGNAFMTLIFYLCQNWRHSLIVISAFSTFLLFVPLLMPESVKWRIARGGKDQHREAKLEIKRIARINRVTISELADDVPLDPDTAAALNVKPPSWTQMIKSKLMVRWVLNMCFGWFFAALTYYGVTFATHSLPLNIYWGFILMSFIEIPFVLSLTVLMKYFGRRTLYTGSFFLAGFAALLFPSIKWIMTAVGKGQSVPNFSLYSTLAVKGFVSIAFNLSYIYTVEIFPSVMRTRGLGFCSMFARIATILSPVIADWQIPGLALDTPFVLLGIMCFVYGLIALDLPETKGKDLPDTLEDLRKLKIKKKETPPPPPALSEPSPPQPENADLNQ
jgi:MFS family permease